MYVDQSPIPNFPPSESGKVMVFEDSDKGTDPDEFISMARTEGATSIDADNDEIFWVVFADEPERVWDFTEQALRGEFRKS